MNTIGYSEVTAFPFNLSLVIVAGVADHVISTGITPLCLFLMRHVSWLTGIGAGTALSLLSALPWLAHDVSLVSVNADPFFMHGRR